MALTLDARYAISIPYGVLRLAAIVVAIIIMICLSPGGSNDAAKSLVWFTVIGSAISSVVFLLLFIIHLPQTLPRLPWAIVEFGLSAFWTAFYFMSFITCCVLSNKWAYYEGGAHAGYGAGAFFCLVNLLAYGAISFLLFRMWRGGVTIETTTTTVDTTQGAKY